MGMGITMRVALLIATLLLSGCAHTPDPWTPEQKVLFGAFTALHTVDLMQTQYIFDSDKYDEMNPIIRGVHDHGGDLAVTSYFVGTWAAVGAACHYMPSKYRTATLWIVTTLNLGVTIRNDHIGVGLGKPF
jgi:hypothetical protein